MTQSPILPQYWALFICTELELEKLKNQDINLESLQQRIYLPGKAFFLTFSFQLN